MESNGKIVAENSKPKGSSYFSAQSARKEIDEFLAGLEQVDGDGKFVRDLRTIIQGACPEYDFDRDSVQERILDHFGSDARDELANQDSSRLRAGFQCVCQRIFGTHFKSTASAADLRIKFFFVRVRLLGHMPLLLKDQSDIVKQALCSGNASFFEMLAKRLRQAEATHPKSLIRRGEPLPKLDIEESLCANWTNPDLPLWMMGDT